MYQFICTQPSEPINRVGQSTILKARLPHADRSPSWKVKPEQRHFLTGIPAEKMYETNPLNMPFIL
jgi:hypothetical protein